MEKSTRKRASAKFAGKNEKTEEYYQSRIAEALSLDADIKAKKARLDEIKAEFYDEFKQEGATTTSIVTPAGTATLKMTNSYSVEADYVPELKKIFKDSFNAYVTEKVSYSPTPALRTKLSDGDYKYIDVIRNAVMIKTTESVELKAIEPILKKARKTA